MNDSVQPQTQATLLKLEKADWFARVGQKDTDAAIVLPSWADAIASCGSDEWGDLQLEAANQYCERLTERSPDRFRRWNDLVAVVKSATIPLVKRKIKSVVSRHDLPTIFEDTVQWDVLHLCMEAEYADVYPPGFFASQAYWYVKGHFPCGWQGTFPDGKLIIY